MSNEKRIPTTEFEIMKLIWDADAAESGVTTGYLMEKYGSEKGWKTPTLITLLNRLCDRGMLRAEKSHRLLRYFPLMSEEEFLRSEVGAISSRFEGRLAGLFCALAERELSDADAEELLRMLDSKDAAK